MCTEHWSNDTNRGKTYVLREKHVPVPLCPQKTPHGLVRDQTWASAVTGWQTATWNLLQPHDTKCGFTKTV